MTTTATIRRSDGPAMRRSTRGLFPGWISSGEKTDARISFREIPRRSKAKRAWRVVISSATLGQTLLRLVVVETFLDEALGFFFALPLDDFHPFVGLKILVVVKEVPDPVQQDRLDVFVRFDVVVEAG